MNEPKQETKQESRDERQDRFVRNMRIGLPIAFGTLLIIFLIAGMYAFVGPTTPTQKKDFVQAVGLLVAGLVALGGLYFTWQNTRTNQRNLLHNQRTLEANQRNTQQTLELTEQGQITERFTRAIDQLGATIDDKEGKPKIEIRLGGIYALERIARDSLRSKVDPGRDYSTVMEVLTAYVRENSPWTPNITTAPNEAAEQQDEDHKQDEMSSPQEHPDDTDDDTDDIKTFVDIRRRLEKYLPQALTADIKAIVDVLRRREEDLVPVRRRPSLDLQKTNLGKANLQEAYLAEADLQGAFLRGANLFRANLRLANLFLANLAQAKLQEAKLQGAYLVGAHLREADLELADLQGAFLRGANLRQANLVGASLRGANLQRAFLYGADLRVDSKGLVGADLRGADLRLANLEGPDIPLSRKKSSHIELIDVPVAEGANLEGADLRGAFLRRGDLWGVEGLTQEQLEQANGDENTKLPDGLERPKSWTQVEDKQEDETDQA